MVNNFNNGDGLNEDADNKKKSSGMDLLEFKKDFIGENLEKLDQSKKNRFLENIMKGGHIDLDLKRELESFRGKYQNKYGHLDISGITIYDLKFLVADNFIKLENNRNDLKKKILKDYEIDKKDYESKIYNRGDIANLSERELQRLIDSDNDLIKFFNKINKNKSDDEKIKKRESFKILDNITPEKLTEKYRKLNEEDKKTVGEILLRCEKNLNLNDTDIRILFETGFFDLAEKKEFISIFIPFITLQQAVDLELIELEVAENNKKEIIKNIFLNNKIYNKEIIEKSFYNIGKDISTESIEENFINSMFDRLNLSDIKIETKELNNFDDKDVLDKIAREIGFKKFEDDLKEREEDLENENIEDGPKSFEQLKKRLQKKFKNLEKFGVGNYIELGKRNEEGKIVNYYIKIKSIDDKKKSLNFFAVSDFPKYGGKTKININKDFNIEEMEYYLLLNKLEEFGSNVNFLDEDDIKLKIKKGELETMDDLGFLTISDLKGENNKKLRDDLKDKYKILLENQISNLEKEIEEKGGEALNTQLVSNLEEKKQKLINIDLIDKIDELSDLDIKNLKIEKNKLKKEINENGKNEIIEKKLNDIEEKLAPIETSESMINLLNYDNLIRKLDEIDPEGSNITKDREKGLFKGMYIKTNEGVFYEIIGIDYDTSEITIEGRGEDGSFKKSNGNFSEFFNSFKNLKATRVEQLDNFGQLIERNKINSKTKEKWDNHEIKDGKFIAKDVKDGDEKGDREVEYLVGDKTDIVVKICRMSGNTVEVQVGKRKNLSDLDKKYYKELGIKLKDGKLKDEDKEREVLEIEGADLYNINLNELDGFIKKHDLYPNWQSGKEKKFPKTKDLQNEFHGSVWSRFFNKISVKEMVQGGKLLINSIEETLKKGNEIHAARFALKLGHRLPEELRSELEIKVESAESEQMEKEIKGLGQVDSWIAAERIRGWLRNRDIPEHKKEAGMLYMLEKYGHLTAKDALYEYRGKYLWYEALGGRINDDFFQSIEAKAKKDDITFSEEYLVHMLLKKQCKSFFSGYKRRTRLHKDYENKWKSGYEAEWEKGHNDASAKRTAKTMVEEGLNEALGGTTTNAFGWFKKAVERGGSIEVMNKGFFSLLYSGSLYNVDQKTLVKIKNLWDVDKMPILIARFCSYKSDMELFNKTILELSERISLSYGDKFPNIYTEALSIFNDAKDGKGKDKDRLQRAMDFWKNYGTPLSRALYMNHTDNIEYAKTDKIVIFEKDKTGILSDYYKKLRNFGGYVPFKEDFMNDACGMEGMGGLSTYEVSKKYLESIKGGGMKYDKEGEYLWDNIVKDIEASKKREFDKNKDLNRIKQKEHIVYMLKEISAALLDRHGGNHDALNSYNNPNSRTGPKLNDWGFDLSLDLVGVNSKMILEGNEADKVFNRVAENILTGGTGINYSNPFNTKEKVIKTIKSNNNDDDDD